MLACRFRDSENTLTRKGCTDRALRGPRVGIRTNSQNCLPALQLKSEVGSGEKV